jgi:hypothetical protein
VSAFLPMMGSLLGGLGGSTAGAGGLGGAAFPVAETDARGMRTGSAFERSGILLPGRSAWRTSMAQSKEMRARAKKFQGRPVCVTLHSGETYVGTGKYQPAAINVGDVADVSLSAVQGDTDRTALKLLSP